MGQTVDDAALDTLFREARSYTKWRQRPVSDETLRDLYELLKLGADELECRTRTVRVSSIKGGERTPSPAAGSAER